MLESLITSKTRLRILVKFFMNVATNGYLRGLAEELNESTNAIRKELNNLMEAGFLEKEASQNKIIYKANIKHPLFAIMQKIVRHHIGIEAMVEMILQKMGDVEKVVIIGDYANGNDSGIIQVILVGKNLHASYIDKLGMKIENEIKRKVEFFLMSEYEDDKGLVIYENTKPTV